MPALPVTNFVRQARLQGIPYRLVTLPLAGYAAADMNGTVEESETAPSARWVKVEIRGQQGDEPDLTDGVVYLDGLVRHLVSTLGTAAEDGVQAYSLDNEPALWNYTHARLHPEPVGIAELLDRSAEAACMVKEIDPGAEIFGPALYGYTAYDHLADTDGSREWETIRDANGYHWFLDCYLDGMRQAGEEAGVRLLDVLDIHYYSESARVGPEDRVQSVRTLWEPGFVENSWIEKWCQVNLPLLPTVRASIDKWYPGTKLAITEYNFGGELDPSGAIAQAEALGCFADQGVYFAAIWGAKHYIIAGLNLYTNYDGQGGHFGETLLPAVSDDVSRCMGYAAVNADRSRVTVTLTNKSQTEPLTVRIPLGSGAPAISTVSVWGVTSLRPKVLPLEDTAALEDGCIVVTLPPWCAALVAAE